jgi:hypothetical protein
MGSIATLHHREGEGVQGQHAPGKRRQQHSECHDYKDIEGRAKKENDISMSMVALSTPIDL